MICIVYICINLMLVVSVEGKGCGIIATKQFKKDELLCEYIGECNSDGVKRDQAYSKDPNNGCYMYFFKHRGKSFW